MWTHEITEGEGEEKKVKATFEIALIELLHDLNNFATQLNYAGQERDAWIRQVVATLPLTLLLRNI